MNRNVLIVDDDNDMVELLTLMLEQSGFAVGVAKEGYTAIDQVNSHHYDLVLLDKSMPFANGLQVLKTIRDNQVTKNLPIIMLTASNDIEDVVRSKELGVSDYIIKPPSKADLISRIERILGGRPQYVEIKFSKDQPEGSGLIGLPVELKSISAAGMVLIAPAPMKKGSTLGTLHIPILQTLNIDSTKLKLSVCRKISEAEYEYFISFININKGDGEKIRDWIMTQTFKGRNPKV